MTLDAGWAPSQLGPVVGVTRGVGDDGIDASGIWLTYDCGYFFYGIADLFEGYDPARWWPVLRVKLAETWVDGKHTGPAMGFATGMSFLIRKENRPRGAITLEAEWLTDNDGDYFTWTLRYSHSLRRRAQF
ncbi:MAG: hypothetical protein ACYTKD_29390 [Planctomycetota bacterium]